MHSSRG